MTTQLEEAMQQLMHKKNKESVHANQVKKHRKWHAMQITRVRSQEFSIQSLQQCVDLLESQVQVEAQATILNYATPNVSPTHQEFHDEESGLYASNFIPPHTATGPTPSPAATPATAIRTLNPYTGSPPPALEESPMHENLQEGGVEFSSSNNDEMATEDDETTLNLKSIGLTDNDNDDAKARGLLPPDDDDNNSGLL